MPGKSQFNKYKPPQADRFLHPGMLKYHRQAVSVDESHPPILRPILSNSGRHNILGSQPTIGSNTSPTHDVLRMIKRSDTAKQHVLARQRNIENEDNHHQHHGTHSPKATPTHNRGRRSVIFEIKIKQSFQILIPRLSNPTADEAPPPQTHQWWRRQVPDVRPQSRVPVWTVGA